MAQTRVAQLLASMDVLTTVVGRLRQAVLHLGISPVFTTLVVGSVLLGMLHGVTAGDSENDEWWTMCILLGDNVWKNDSCVGMTY